jgi:hypothetical protein
MYILHFYFINRPLAALSRLTQTTADKQTFSLRDRYYVFFVRVSHSFTNFAVSKSKPSSMRSEKTAIAAR